MRSIAHVSEQTTNASSSRPSASGRKPCGSRTAISRSLRQHQERERALDLRHRLDDGVLDAGGLRARVEMQHDLGVGARLEDRALPHQLVAQLAGVHEVAVVADRDLAVRAVDENGCAFDKLALAGGRIAHVADRQRARAASPASRRRRRRRRSPSRARRARCSPSDAAMPALSWPRCCSAYRPR